MLDTFDHDNDPVFDAAVRVGFPEEDRTYTGPIYDLPMVIGITGFKGHGKSTVADMIAEHWLALQHKHNLPLPGVVRGAFADKLKAAAQDIWNLSDEAVHGTQEQKETIIPEWGLSGRDILKPFGTETARAVHRETWIRALFRKYNGTSSMLVVSDVRFPNEASAIRKHGGLIIRVHRLSVPTNEQHASERGTRGFRADLTILNTGSLADLRATVEAAILGSFPVRRPE